METERKKEQFWRYIKLNFKDKIILLERKIEITMREKIKAIKRKKN